jgi:hypothetical protein
VHREDHAHPEVGRGIDVTTLTRVGTIAIDETAVDRLAHSRERQHVERRGENERGEKEPFVSVGRSIVAVSSPDRMQRRFRRRFG